MLNMAGPDFDFGRVLYAVLLECEHQRRGLAPEEAAGRLRDAARAKLAEIRESYEECGGTEPYWRELEREVLDTTLPEYVPAALEQTRLEKTNYGLWRRGDPVARAVFGLLGLVIGGLIIMAPFIPIFEDAFAFVLAAAGFLYPEVAKTAYDYRHSRFLNRLIARAEKYQYDPRIHYTSSARLEEELGTTAPKARGARSPEGEESERPRPVVVRTPSSGGKGG
jgi:hypothetical protein